MNIHALAQARLRTRTTLAVTLKAAHPEIAQIEKRMDVYIETLRRSIQAMGGELEIVAHFPECAVTITRFETEWEG